MNANNGRRERGIWQNLNDRKASRLCKNAKRQEPVVNCTGSREFFDATIVYTAVVSAVLIKLIDLVMGIRVDEDSEREGLDIRLHGESVM